MNEREVAILASKRLKSDGRGVLPLMSMVQNALSNLSRLVANDPQRRYLLMSDRASVQETITNASPFSYCDLALTLMPTYQIMLEYLNYGSIFFEYAPTFVAGDVDTGSDLINLTSGAFFENDRVHVSNVGGSLPSGLSGNTNYYIKFESPGANEKVQFLTTPGDDSTLVDLTTTGSGTQTITLQGAQVCQWTTTPNISDLTSAIPFPYTYIWLEQNLLYTNRVIGDFVFLVPFTPTLDTLPTALEGDLVDQVVTLAISSGYEALRPSQT